MKIAEKIFVAVRIIIGIFLVVSGYEKLISPLQNFLYVVQSYELGNASLEALTVQVIPWVELFLGIFLVLGLWLPLVLRCSWVLVLSFILIVAQALVRKLPIDECGCFGELLHIPPKIIVVFDTTLLILTTLLIIFVQKTSRFSLDRYYLNRK